MSKLIRAVSLCFAVILWAVPAGARAADIAFPLVQDGKAVASVVVAGDNEDLLAAVDDLATYIKQMTGAELKVVRGTKDLPGPTLHLGETELFPRLVDTLPQIKLDGFAMAAVGEDLLVAGKMPQGTANGIVTILQDQFGVRWYAAGSLWEIVPAHRSLVIKFAATSGPAARVENPSFQGRHLRDHWKAPEFRRRMRISLPGVKMPYVGTSHMLKRVVPAEKYGKDHPDYFPLNNGQRMITGDANPCYSHPDMPEVFMAYIREGNVGLGVNDNLTACRCERCLAMDGKSKPYKGMWNASESYYQLIAKVAALTAKEFPDRRLGTMAYQLTNTPPQSIAYIGKNVDIELCQDTSQYFDPEYKKLDQQMSAEWVTKAGGVHFYDYVGIEYWLPRYFPHILADQLHHLAHVGVKGYVTHLMNMPDTSMPMNYLLCQALWNADVDPDRMIDTMLKDLYGPAVGPIQKFYGLWESCWTRQTKSHWLFGLDALGAELTLYSPRELEEGAKLLEQAASLAVDAKARERITYLQQFFGFSLATIRLCDVCRRALLDPPPETSEQAIAMSKLAKDDWCDFAERLTAAEKLPGSSVSGQHSRSTRIRIWGLKQQARDAVVAPLLRWCCAHEGKSDPQQLRAIERQMADLAIASRRAIEERVTQTISAVPHLPQANALRVTDVAQSDRPIDLQASEQDWPGIAPITTLPWVFHNQPEETRKQRYDDPGDEHLVATPAPADQSMSWQCTWDSQRLYLRVVVRDDMHHQGQRADQMWKDDSVQIALNPRRGLYDSRGPSFEYLMGGYRGDEIEFGLSLHDDKPELHVWRVPRSFKGTDMRSLIRSAVARHGDRTIYEAAVDWKLLTGFVPQPEHSLGVCLVVNDVDQGERRIADYGSGLISHKHSPDFAAIRLTQSGKPSPAQSTTTAPARPTQ
jgi:hypothetical protein